MGGDAHEKERERERERERGKGGGGCCAWLWVSVGVGVPEAGVVRQERSGRWAWKGVMRVVRVVRVERGESRDCGLRIRKWRLGIREAA